MSRSSYAETVAADPSHRRLDEQVAFRRLATMLDAAEEHGPGSRQAVEAITKVSALWSALLEDLVRPENDLPVELRARLVSVGIFLLKEVEAIRSGRSTDFQVLREITSSIAEGLS